MKINQRSNTSYIANVEFPSQFINLLVTGRCISLGEYYIRWETSIIKIVLVLTVAVSRYSATIEVAYLAGYNEMELSFIWKILIDMNQCAYPSKFT